MSVPHEIFLNFLGKVWFFVLNYLALKVQWNGLKGSHFDNECNYLCHLLPHLILCLHCQNVSNYGTVLSAEFYKLRRKFWVVNPGSQKGNNFFHLCIIIIRFFRKLIVFTVNEHKNICIVGLNHRLATPLVVIHASLAGLGCGLY